MFFEVTLKIFRGPIGVSNGERLYRASKDANTQDALIRYLTKNGILSEKRFICSENEPKTLAYDVNSNFESHMQLIGHNLLQTIDSKSSKL